MAKKAFKKDWSKITKQIKNRNTKFKKDDRILEPQFDSKTNKAKITMRLLDAIDGDTTDGLPYVEIKQHFFKDKGGWFINICPTTVDDDASCPICEDLYENDYYNTDNDLYYDRKKKSSFYINALIIDDTVTPENNGKVFIVKLGVKIMDKVEETLTEGEVPWDDNMGVNFVFSAKKNGKMSDYSASRFSDKQTALSDYGDDDEINGQRHELITLTKDIKAYDTLMKLYKEKIGESVSGGKDNTKRQKVDEVTEEVIEDEAEDDEVINDDNVGDGTVFDDDDDDGFFDDLD